MSYEDWCATNGAGDLPTRAAFLMFPRFSLLRAGAVWLYSCCTGQNALARRLVVVCVYRHGRQFSRCRCAGGETSIDNPGYVHISRFTIWGINEGLETSYCLCWDVYSLHGLRGLRGSSVRCAG